MYFRYMVESDMGNLAQVLTECYTQHIQYTGEACRDWFKMTPLKVVGIFSDSDEMIGFLFFSIHPNKIYYAKDCSILPQYRTAVQAKEIAEKGFNWFIGEGAETLKIETCAGDYKVISLYTELGFGIVDYIQKRVNFEDGVVLEVKLGR